jgi:peptide/nickel transport system substrate-binding protein
VRRHRWLIALLIVLVSGSALAQAGSSARGQEGGMLRITLSPAAGVVLLDPAHEFTPAGWSLLDATCARLMTYPDKPAPLSYVLQPEVAARYEVSGDFKTYTFTLRRGFRFSDGRPVRASAFANAINRALQPFVNAPAAIHMQDIVGAVDVLEGRRRTASGVVARGDTLVVRLTRPAPDFPARTAMPFFCAVPPDLPHSAEGIAKFHSAGPYYVEEYRANERVVIKRNRYYGGTRRVHLEGFEVDLRGGSPQDQIRRVERDEADWGHMLAGQFFIDPTLDLVGKYGINRSEFFVKPGLTLRMLAFNAKRPLFRNNPRLRRAINYALDRKALLGTAGGPIASRSTDQYLPYGIPGFRNSDIYPLAGQNLARARALARGNLRGRKAVMYTTAVLPAMALAQLVKQQLAEIGLAVEIAPIPLHLASAAYLERLSARGEGWDLALVLWTPNIPDPHAYLNQLLEAQRLDGRTLTGFRSRVASQELSQTARRLQGRAREDAYARLDALLARDYAPLAALDVVNEVTLVSNRVGCIVLRPAFDLAVACLK